MSQILSSNEVDALMAVMSQGVVGPAEAEPEAAAPAVVERIDLSKQGRIRRGAMPVLDIVHEKFGRQLRSELSVELRKIVDIEHGLSHLIRLGEFMNTLPRRCCLSSFTMEPLKGSGVVVVDSKLVYAIVEIYCGGISSEHFDVEDREFTVIELRMVRRIVNIVLEILSKAWQPVHPVEFRFERIETNPQFIALGHPSEVVIVAPLIVDVEGTKGLLNVVLPYNVLAPIKQKLEGGFVVEQKEVQNHWRRNIGAQIKEVDIDVRTLFGRGSITVKGLIEMKPGDTLILNTRPGDEVEVEVGGKHKLLGSTGIYRGYKAVQISRTADT